MKIYKGRIFLLIALCLVFVFTACNNGSFDVTTTNGGGNGEGGNEIDFGDSVCRIGDTGYPTLEAAIAAAAAGTANCEITMLRDTTEAVEIPKGADITLDLNGCTVSYKGDSVENDKSTITNKGKLVLTCKKGEGVVTNATNTESQNACVLNWIGATAFLEGSSSGTVKILRDKDVYTTHNNPDNKNGYAVYNRGTMTINAGVNIISTDLGSNNSLVSTGHYKIQNDIVSGLFASDNIPMAVLTINGGVLNGCKNAIKVDSAGKCIINGGEICGLEFAIRNYNILEINGGNLSFSGNVNTARAEERTSFHVIRQGIPPYPNPPVDQGKCTITGGTLSQPEGIGDYALFGNDPINNTDGAEIFITGGEFIGRIKNLSPATKISISGGNCAFSEDCSANVIFADENAELRKDSDGFWRIYIIPSP